MMTGLATRKIKKKTTLTIVQRLTEKDKTAVAECIDTYGNFVWALAQKFTASNEEAETAAQEIFLDIWRYAERAADAPAPAEKLLIALIARQRLIKFLR